MGEGATLTSGIRRAELDQYLWANGQFLLQAEGRKCPKDSQTACSDDTSSFTRAPGG